MPMRVWMAGLAALLWGGGPIAAQEMVLTPSPDEVRAHMIHLVEPVRRPGVRLFETNGVGVILTVSETGHVEDAVLEPADDVEPPRPDVAEEALANARAATFEPFMQDGVARRARVVIGVSLLPPAKVPQRHTPFPDTAGRDVGIRFERTLCFGTCPAYVLEIRGDGLVTYDGQGFVAIEGVHHRTISPEAVAELLEMFRAADFYSLDDDYSASVTDNPTQTITLTIGGQRKTVSDYVGLEAGMPFAVERLEHAIDRIAGVRTWVEGDAATADLLATEGYDFTSPAAGRALRWMAWEGSEDAALDFVARGAPLDAGDGDEGFGARGPAVDGAAFHGRTRLLRALIERGALEQRSTAESALASAARSRDPAVLEVVLDAARFDRRQLGRALTAALNEEAWSDPERDATPVVDRLLALHADVTVANREGKTPLHGATTPEMVRKLLALGAELEA
jgi:hypothetical protein